MMDPRMAAGVDMIGRTGSLTFEIRFSEPEEDMESPSKVVWIALASWPGERWETAAALDPTEAVMRLCEKAIDGGTCVHCAKATGFTADFDDMTTGYAPIDDTICWYQFDPELATFRRSCGGDGS